MTGLTVIILAAGQGTRMSSSLPKVLHPVAGLPMLGHVINAAMSLDTEDIVVVHGFGGEAVKSAFADTSVIWREQKEQLGTGHAVAQAQDVIPDDHTILILYGDVPLIKTETLSAMLEQVSETSMSLLTVVLQDPHGYGRILRNTENKVSGIIEHKDASGEQLKVAEINTGILAVNGRLLKNWLGRLSNNNAQGEYYLTDIFAIAANEGINIEVHQTDDESEVMGVNDRVQLAYVERCYQKRKAEKLMRAGATLLDPARIDVRGDVEIGNDSIVDINVIFDGNVKIGSNVSIGANNVIRNSVIADGVVIKENCVIENAVVGKSCIIGPFARLRPEAELLEQVHVGNFVEIKKSLVKNRSKINHLSYIGDTRVGEDVNIGAGTITCNYDGAFKHKTIIGDRAFIGSDTQLVAPVSIADGATIGAGSTITRDCPSEELTLSRSKQLTINGWKRPQKNKV